MRFQSSSSVLMDPSQPRSSEFPVIFCVDWRRCHFYTLDTMQSLFYAITYELMKKLLKIDFELLQSCVSFPVYLRIKTKLSALATALLNCTFLSAFFKAVIK